MLAQLSIVLLPLFAGAGWLWGRHNQQKQPREVSRIFRNNYFKGLNFLINEQPDKAVDVFIELLEVDSDTVETHLALGNLFRRRGEVDRAIRIHQNLIARPELDKQNKVQALSALGQDYLRAGVLDRAERLFLELVEIGEENQSSLRFLLRIYEQEKDWEKAINTAQKLQAVTNESMQKTIAQYYCELAELSSEKGYLQSAYSYLKRAQITDGTCVRASLIRARLEAQAGSYKEAIRYYKRVLNQDPDYISEIVDPLRRCYQQLGEEAKGLQYLRNCLELYPRISIVLVISDYLQKQEGDHAAIEFIAEQIQRRPSLRGLNHLVNIYIVNSFGEAKEKLLLLRKFMDQLLADKPVYQCNHCGLAGMALYWLCPSCHHWGTVRPIQGLEGN